MSGYNFYRFWVIKGKPTRGKITPATQIQVKPMKYEPTVFVLLIKTQVQN